VTTLNAESVQGRPVLPLCVMGDNAVLHRVVCALAQARLQHAAELAMVQVRLYVAPVGDNDVADFLARHDALYRRQVFLPFRRHTFVPRIGLDTPCRESPLSRNAFVPVAMQRALLRDYFDAADHVVKIRIFECQCWSRLSEKKQGARPDVTLPFCMRLELGINADVAHFKATEPEVSEKSWEECVVDRRLASRERSLCTPALDVEFREANMRGRVQEVAPSADGAQSYGMVRLSNMADPTLPPAPERPAPDPTQPFLELELVPKTALASIVGRRVREVDALKRCLTREGRYHHVGSFEARVADAGSGGAGASVGSGQGFLVLADGQVFGPFQAIKVAAQAPTEQLTLPVASMLPLDL